MYILFLLAQIIYQSEYCNKTGCYFNAGLEQNLSKESIFSNKKNSVFLKVTEISDSYSFGCFYDKEKNSCYTIDNPEVFKTIINDRDFTLSSLKINSTSLSPTPLPNGEGLKKIDNIELDNNENLNLINYNYIDVRTDKTIVYEPTKKYDFSNEKDSFLTHKTPFKLIFFEKKESDEEKKTINGSFHLYNRGNLEVNESKLNSLLSVFQGDFSYNNEIDTFNTVFDSDSFLQKSNSSYQFNMYSLYYSRKIGNFSLKIGRSGVDDIFSLELIDAIFISYNLDNFKFTILSGFGVDYDSMITDFDRIYSGGAISSNFRFENITLDSILSITPQFFKDDNYNLSIFSTEFQQDISILNRFDIIYYVKYSRFNDSNYWNLYLKLNYDISKKIKLSIFFDSRDGLNYYSYSYYKDVLESLDLNDSKYISSSLFYFGGGFSIFASYRYRFETENAKYSHFPSLFFRKYFKNIPIELSFRVSSLIQNEIKIYIFDAVVDYKLYSTLTLWLDILFMLEDSSEVDSKSPSFIPQVGSLWHFYDNYYMKSYIMFQLRGKNLTGVVNIGKSF